MEKRVSERLENLKKSFSKVFGENKWVAENARVLLRIFVNEVVQGFFVVRFF